MFLYKRGAFTNAKKQDIVLLDSNLPIFNGPEVVQHIKADSKPKKILAVMRTTSTKKPVRSLRKPLQ